MLFCKNKFNKVVSTGMGKDHMRNFLAFLTILLLMNYSAYAISEAIPVDSNQNALLLKHIDQVAISPDGKQVAYTVRQFKRNNQGWYNEYTLYLDVSGKIKLISSGNNRISNLNWLSDGKRISFLSKGDNNQSIWIRDTQTNKLQKILEAKADINTFKWSPDGNSLAYIVDEVIANKKHIGRLYLAKNVTKDLQTFPLTSAEYNILQLDDLAEDNGFDWAPDGKSIVFSFQTCSGSYFNDSYKIAIIEVNSHSIQNISYTDSHDGIRPHYAPNGSWIAFSSNDRTSNVKDSLKSLIYSSNKVCVYNSKSYKTDCLKNTFNENPTILGWDKNSDAIIVLDWYKTSGIQLYKLHLRSTDPVELFSNGTGFIEPLTVSLNNTNTMIGFGYETNSKPAEVYITPSDKFQTQKISNAQSPPPKNLPNIQKISWFSKDHIQVDGLLITPHDFNSQKKYPLLVILHGGPNSAFAERYTGGCNDGYEMTLPNCWPDLTEKGFVIFQPNYRGSNGYGTRFRFANHADIGGGDYQDAISGVSYLVKKGIADANRLAIFGWSYGGYLTLWAITQTNIFKAAIAGSGYSDLISFAKTTDIPWYLPAYLGATYWENSNLYKNRSPISWVQNVTTPLLMIYGVNDKRVPGIQSNEFYNALKNENKTAKIIAMPGQGHMPTEPNIIFNNKQEVDKWLMGI